MDEEIWLKKRKDKRFLNDDDEEEKERNFYYLKIVPSKCLELARSFEYELTTSCILHFLDPS